MRKMPNPHNFRLAYVALPHGANREIAHIGHFVALWRFFSDSFFSSFLLLFLPRLGLLGLLRNKKIDVFEMFPNARDVQFLGHRSVAGAT